MFCLNFNCIVCFIDAFVVESQLCQEVWLRSSVHMQCCFAANCDRYQNLIFSKSTLWLTLCRGHHQTQMRFQAPPFKSLVKAYHALLHSLTENKSRFVSISEDKTIQSHLSSSSADGSFLALFLRDPACSSSLSSIFFVLNTCAKMSLWKFDKRKRKRGKTLFFVIWKCFFVPS